MGIVLVLLKKLGDGFVAIYVRGDQCMPYFSCFAGSRDIMLFLRGRYEVVAFYFEEKLH